MAANVHSNDGGFAGAGGESFCRTPIGRKNIPDLQKQAGEPDMDAVNRRILRELRFEARLSNAELATRVGLSATSCWNRVKALERDGVIERYVTIFDQAALGVPDTVIVEITLDHHDDETLSRFEEALARHSGLRVVPPAMAGLDPAWVTEEGGLRLRPDYWPDLGGMDGFYIAVLTKPA